MNANPEKP